ncbi:MAG: S8 family serine peptidase, partial [Phycisphaeraceae bacterium]|nr:S8 family serine peptidase [Phycisphaeraceae bacterium]
MGFALEAAIAVGIQSLEGDLALGVEAVAGVDLAVGVAIFELFGFAPLAIRDAGVEFAVARGVGLFLDDLARDFGAVEGDAFGLAVAVAVSFIAAALAAGVLPIAAAGNSGGTNLGYPASYDAVVSVAAVDSSEELASFSTRNDQVEIAAPGVSILSTVINGGYESYSGTSMA